MTWRSVSTAFLFALACLAFSLSHAVDGSSFPALDSCAPAVRDYTPVQPEWDLGYIQQCNAGCQSAYPIEFGRKNYNLCYACICLIGAAEDAGELVSAQAQCEDAQGW